MKNQALFKTGGKPAPGELIIVQGFMNTLDIEEGIDEISSGKSLKTWLIHRALLGSQAKVTSRDLNTALSFREALRQMALANNGQTVPGEALKQINNLISRFKLAITFEKDGALSFLPNSGGINGVCEYILARVVQAVGEGTWYRLKACDDPNCRWVFYDNSKNHSGRWCSMSVCGSRDKARAYRRRLKS